MSEFYFRAPSPEELAVTYNGMAFAEFRQLSDEQVDALRIQQRVEHFTAIDDWEARCEKMSDAAREKYLFGDPEYKESANKVVIFNTFFRWRKYGVPDRNMTEDEFLERMYHYADTRRAANADYGKFPEAAFAKLPEWERKAALFALDDAWEDGDSFVGQPVIQDIEGVAKQSGFGVDTLVKRGVLARYETPASVMFDGGIGYVVIGSYATCLFAKRYPEATAN